MTLSTLCSSLTLSGDTGGPSIGGPTVKSSAVEGPTMRCPAVCPAHLTLSALSRQEIGGREQGRKEGAGA